jgi:hypothetical protein
LGYLPNLVGVDIDPSNDRIYDVLKALASHRKLGSLSIMPRENYRGGANQLHPRGVSELLPNLPNLVSFSICHVCGEDLPKLMETITSMPQLTKVHLSDIPSLDGSWAIPFASGGLSDLSLKYCKNIDLAGVDALLAAHSHTLKRLTLDNVARQRDLGPGPQSELNHLERLSLRYLDADEKFLRRFSNSPIVSIKVSPLAPRRSNKNDFFCGR